MTVVPTSYGARRLREGHIIGVSQDCVFFAAMAEVACSAQYVAMSSSLWVGERVSVRSVEPRACTSTTFGRPAFVSAFPPPPRIRTARVRLELHSDDETVGGAPLHVACYLSIAI